MTGASASDDDGQPAAPAPPRWRRLAPPVVATLLLALALVDLPGPPSRGLDESHPLSLLHAHRVGLQFGPEVTFTYGPLGFLRARFACDGVPAAAFAWKTWGALALAATLVALGAGLPPVRRVLLWGSIALLWPEESALVAFLVLVIVRWALPAPAGADPGPGPPWRLALALGWLAFLAQVKLTFLVLAFGGVAVAATAHALRGERRRALGIAAAFVAALLAGWLVAGQSLANLPTYLGVGREITTGFGRAMGVNELRWPVWTAAHVTLALLGAAAAASLRGRDRLQHLPALLVLAGAWFMIWRHGFTRADGHAVGFFATTAVLAIALPPSLARGARRWLDACPAVCLAGIALFDPGQLPRPLGLVERLAATSRALLDLEGWRADLAADEARARAAADRPDLRARIGAGTVDHLGYDSAWLLLNGLSYRPRPVFQSYSAYTPALLRHNARFFASSAAPEFVVARLETIDGRFPAQDDSLALLELRRRYEATYWTEREVLVRRRPAQPGAARPPEVVVDRAVELGEDVALPPSRDAALWARIEVAPTLRGRLRALAVSEAPLELVVIDSAGDAITRRLIPSIAEEGFVIQPLLLEQPDLTAFMRGRGRRWARSLRVQVARRYRRCWAEARVQVWRLPDCPVDAVDPNLQWVEAGYIDVVPREVSSEVAVETWEAQGLRALQVHAPGRIVVRAAGARRLTGLHGLRRGDLPPDPGDGVVFSARAVHDDGREELLWRRHVRPREDPGPHPLDLPLPAGDYELVLETGPGPREDARCDWSYWSQLRFE